MIDYARGKLDRKGLDMIVANDVSDPGIGFNSEENEVTVLWRGGEKRLQRSTKALVASHIVKLIAGRLSGDL